MRRQIARVLRRLADRIYPAPVVVLTDQPPNLDELRRWNELIYGTSVEPHAVPSGFRMGRVAYTPSQD